MMKSRQFTLTLAIATTLVLTGCLPDGEQTKDAKLVEQQQSQYAKAQPIPVYDWSLERDLLINLYNIHTPTLGRIGKCFLQVNKLGEIGFSAGSDVELHFVFTRLARRKFQLDLPCGARTSQIEHHRRTWLRRGLDNT